MDELAHTREAVKQARAALEAETDELVRISRRLNENLMEAVRRIWRQLLLIWSVLGAFTLTYVLVMVYAPPGGRAPAVPMASPVTPAIPPALPAGAVREELTGLLNRIREAQYAKDLELFFSSYSPTLPDLARKRELIESLWQRYDYLDMRYQIKDLTEAGEGLVRGTVAWEFTTRDRLTQAIRNYRKTYQVQLRKASGRWLIEEVRTVTEEGTPEPRPQ